MTRMKALGDSLSRLIEAQGSRLLEATLVSPLRSATAARAAFRLLFADGTLLKGRRLESAQQAGTVWAMSRAVQDSWPGAPLAKVRAWHGDALLEQWLPGKPLTGAPMRMVELRRAGTMLGRLHRSVRIQAPLTRHVDPTWVERALDATSVVTIGVLDAKLVAAAVGLARQAQPRMADWGCCHGDFCDENLLRVPKRGMRLIDNETLGEHWFDHDLARTWYRWHLPSPQWAAFLDGYSQERDLAAFERHAIFWCLCVLLRATEFRRRHQLDATVPLTRLAALCRERVAT